MTSVFASKRALKEERKFWQVMPWHNITQGDIWRHALKCYRSPHRSGSGFLKHLVILASRWCVWCVVTCCGSWGRGIPAIHCILRSPHCAIEALVKLLHIPRVPCVMYQRPHSPSVEQIPPLISPRPEDVLEASGSDIAWPVFPLCTANAMWITHSLTRVQPLCPLCSSDRTYFDLQQVCVKLVHWWCAPDHLH